MPVGLFELKASVFSLSSFFGHRTRPLYKLQPIASRFAFNGEVLAMSEKPFYHDKKLTTSLF